LSACGWRKINIIKYNNKNLEEMTQEEKIAMLEEVLEIDNGTLTPDMKLEDVESYDSMAKLTIIVMMDDEFNKKLTGEKLLEFKTVGDILDFME
jgi:acyl carrier protein